VDETTLSLNYPIYNCWMRRGQQKAIPAFSGKREYLHVIGAYNWRTDCVTGIQVERKNGDGFITFLEELLVKTYSTQSVILVMDNASYHYSAAVRAALNLFAHRVRVFWLPPYCPELNAIERFWRHLKQTAWANKLYTTIPILAQNVSRVLAQQNEPSFPERFTFVKIFR
jgi:transposase